MSSGALSSILGGGGVPVGASVPIQDAPVNFTYQGVEWLRAGAVKAYDASYANSIATAPQLRVYGNDAMCIGFGSTGNPSRYGYVGTNFFAWTTNTCFYGSTLAITQSGVNVSTIPTVANVSRVASSGTWSALPHGSANNPIQVTSDGITWSGSGGTFTTFTTPTAICFGNNSWVACSGLAGAAGSYAYISAANPSGAWTVAVSTGASIATIKAIAYGLVSGTTPTFCAVGVYGAGGATSGKIATTGAVNSAWSDRTAASGIPFVLSTDSGVDVVHDGTKFIGLFSINGALKCYTSTDAITWAAGGSIPFDGGSTPFGTTVVTTQPNELQTDGAGTVIAYNTATGSTSKPIFFISTDHGVTWAIGQVYIGKIATPITGSKYFGFVNGHWVESHGGAIGGGGGILDYGASSTFNTVNYIGQQYSPAAGNYIRIK